jgi:hypothetical protein
MKEPLGFAAYEGYMAACGGRSLISGQTLPNWEDQDVRIREAWDAAATEVLRREYQRRSLD